MRTFCQKMVDQSLGLASSLRVVPLAGQTGKSQLVCLRIGQPGVGGRFRCRSAAGTPIAL